ncbi:STAS domain-containing protein [Kaarinaea lacus]
MSSTLQITVLENQGNEHVTVINLKGELDGNTYKDLQAKVDEIIAGNVNNLLIDMSDLSFMGSAGLRALHTSSNSAKENGGTVKLLKPSDAAKRVLKTLGFDQFFDVFDDLDEAIKSF